jgi:hypothetical protein
MMLAITRQTLALELKQIEVVRVIVLCYRFINIVSPERLRVLGREI